MTDEQKYCELLKEIGKLLKQKDDEIEFKDYQINDLKKKLAEAEEKIQHGVKVFETR